MANTGRNFSLTDRQQRFVSAQVANGRHASGSEVIREALRRYEDDILREQARVAALNRLAEEAEAAHARGALLIAVFTEALSLGAVRAPGDMGADIVVGEGQSIGNALSFGGPAAQIGVGFPPHLRKTDADPRFRAPGPDPHLDPRPGTVRFGASGGASYTGSCRRPQVVTSQLAHADRRSREQRASCAGN